MGIIGVVAALTLPNLNSSTGNKEKVAKVKKIYQNLNDAMGRATAVYGPYDEWFINDTTPEQKHKRVAERLTEFMKLSKNCGFSANGECFVKNIKNNKNGESSDVASQNYYKAVLADGTGILIDCANGSIFIDIDGVNKGSNKASKDIFAFYIDSNTGEIIPEGDYYNTNSSVFSCGCLSNGATACTSWVIMNENMDYLKADNSGKCPDGKTILDGVTNTTCK